MKRTLIMAALLSQAFFQPAILASESERPDHFKGKASETLEQAVKNLNEGNKELKAYITDNLKPETMAKIHQLSYTLESALKKIDADLEHLKITLEDVHVASEKMDFDTVKKQSEVYLQRTKEFLKKTTAQ